MLADQIHEAGSILGGNQQCHKGTISAHVNMNGSAGFTMEMMCVLSPQGWMVHSSTDRAVACLRH